MQLKLFNPNRFKKFPKIPQGSYSFIITDWDFDPHKSVVTVTIETPSRIEWDENFYLRKRDGSINYVAHKSLFSLMEVALNRELPLITELEMGEAIGKYIRANMIYSQGEEKIFANLDPESFEADDGAAFKPNASRFAWDWTCDEY